MKSPPNQAEGAAAMQRTSKREAWSARQTATHLIIAALLSALLAILSLRNGIIATSDSWAFWEASVSLLESGSYDYLHGQPVIAWPPLFPLYLAAFQYFGGQTGSTLICAMAFLAVLNTLAWGRFAVLLAHESGADMPGWTLPACLLFIACFTALCSSMLTANFLLLAFHGAAYVAFLRILRSNSGERCLPQAAVLAAVSAGAVLSHNSAVGMIIPFGLLVALCASGNLWKKIAASLIVVILPLMTGALMRTALGQSGSHAFSSDFFEPWRRLIEFAVGLGNFFFNETGIWNALIGAVFFILPPLFLLQRGRPPFGDRITAVMLSAYLASLLLFFLFNSTYVSNRLHGRFLWFIPLTMAPVLIALLAKRRLLLAAAVICLLLPSLLRSVKYSLEGFVPETALSGELAQDINIRPSYYLSGAHKTLPHTGILRVAPPSYPWQTRWDTAVDASVQHRVRLLEAE